MLVVISRLSLVLLSGVFFIKIPKLISLVATLLSSLSCNLLQMLGGLNKVPVSFNLTEVVNSQEELGLAEVAPHSIALFTPHPAPSTLHPAPPR